jgi:hypothetical protein
MTVSPDPYSQDDDDKFNQVTSGFHSNTYQPPTSADASPYGPNPYIPAHSIPTKPGLTRRGKTALAIGATVLATGSFLTWQHYDAEAAANQARAQELALQRDQIALEMQKELNKATATSQKTQSVADRTRQKQIDACVNDNKGLVGKQLGTTLSSVISDCQAQYPAGGSGPDGIQEAASATTAGGGGIGVGGGLAIAGGVLIVGLYGASRRSRTTTNYHHA